MVTRPTNRTLHVVAILALLVAVLLPLLSVAAPAGVQAQQDPAPTRERNRNRGQNRGQDAATAPAEVVPDAEQGAATEPAGADQDAAAAPTGAEQAAPGGRPARFAATVDVDGDTFHFDRVVPLDPAELTEVGGDGDATILAASGQGPFDRVYVSAASRPEPVARYLPETPVADGCLAQTQAFGDIATADATYAFAGPETDVGTEGLEPAFATQTGETVYADPEQQPARELLVESAGGLLRFVILDAEQRPPGFGEELSFAGQDFAFDGEVPANVDQTTLTSVGCVGPFELLAPADEAESPFGQVYAAVGARLLSYAGTGQAGAPETGEGTATGETEAGATAAGEGDETAPVDETAITDDGTPADETVAAPADDTVEADDLTDADETAVVDGTVEAPETAVAEETIAAEGTAAPEETAAGDATADAGDEQPVAAGDFPREVTVDDARFFLDRPVPADLSGLTEVGEDQGLALFSPDAAAPFGRLYAGQDAGEAQPGRYLPELPIGDDGTPSPDGACPADAGNFAIVDLGGPRYVFAGIEPDLSADQLQVITTTSEGDPIYAETTASPFPEFYVETNGELNRFVLLDDRGLPGTLADTITFGGQTFAFDGDVTDQVDPTGLDEAGCAGSFPARTNPGETVGALSQLFVILNDQTPRVLAFTAQGGAPTATVPPGGAETGTPGAATEVPTETATAPPAIEAPTNTPPPATETPAPTATEVPPTATPEPTATPVPPTETPTPTATPVPPTATAEPTETPVPPTATPEPTETPVPPTATPEPTETPAPPTETPEPTETAVPATQTPAPTETPEPATETAEPVETEEPTETATAEAPTATEAATETAEATGEAAQAATNTPGPPTDAAPTPLALATVPPPTTPVSAIPVDAPPPVPAELPREIEVQGVRYTFDLEVDVDVQGLTQIDVVQAPDTTLTVFASQDDQASLGRRSYLRQGALQGPFNRIYAVATTGVIARYVSQVTLTTAGTVDLDTGCSSEAQADSFAYTFDNQQYQYTFASVEVNVSIEQLRTSTVAVVGQVPTLDGGRELLVRQGASQFAEVFVSSRNELRRYTALNAVGLPVSLNNLVFAETQFSLEAQVDVSISQAGFRRVGCSGAFPIFAPPAQAEAQAPLAACFTVVDNRVYQFVATTIVEAPRGQAPVPVAVVPPPAGVVQVTLQFQQAGPSPTAIPNIRVVPVPAQPGTTPVPTPATGVVSVRQVSPRECPGDPGQPGEDGLPERLPSRIQLSGIAYAFRAQEEVGGDIRLTRIGCVGPFEAAQAEGTDVQQVIYLRSSRFAESLFRFEAVTSFNVQFTVAANAQVITANDESYNLGQTWERSVYSSYTVIIFAEDPNALDPPRIYSVPVDSDVIAEYVPEGGDVVEPSEELAARAGEFGINPDVVLGGQRRYLLVNLWTPVGTTTNGWVTLFSSVGEGVADVLLATDPRSLDLFIYRRSGA